MSQFWRALGELGVELIPAHSPQAKSRVERLFRTFQDRLIKELRLAGVATLDRANRFVATDLPIYNQRFSDQPVQPADLHRPRPASRDLDRSLCLKTTRCLRRDWTVAHHGQVEERVDGTMRLTHHGSTAHVSGDRRASAASAVPSHDRAPAAAGHADTRASVAQTTAADTRTTLGGGHHINRTCLLWLDR